MNKLDITHLVPNFILGDKNGWALAKAIEAGLQIYLEKIQGGIDTVLNPDNMPEWRLDELAKDENIFWYDYHADIAVKREIVKNARKVYALLGTKAGSERAAQDFASDAKIEEWFDYGGNASHFRIYSRMGEAADYAQAMARSVNDVKRLTSVLDGIYIDHYPLTAQLYAALALYYVNKLYLSMEPITDLRKFIIDESGNAKIYGSYINAIGELTNQWLSIDEHGNGIIE